MDVMLALRDVQRTLKGPASMHANHKHKSAQLALWWLSGMASSFIRTQLNQTLPRSVRDAIVADSIGLARIGGWRYIRCHHALLNQQSCLLHRLDKFACNCGKRRRAFNRLQGLVLPAEI